MQDRLLIWRLKRGSDEALREVYERTRDDLLRLALSLLNDVSQAEDVVHDVFIGFVRSIPSFQLTGSLKGYLGTCVANRARNLNREEQRHQVAQSDDRLDRVSVWAGADHWVECSERFKRIREALSQLPYEQREAVTLHIYAQMTFRAMAEARGVSLKTMQSRYRYGLDKLRRLLGNEVSL